MTDVWAAWVRDVCYHYADGTEGLSGATLQVREGTAIGLIGPNGAGKSTLLLHLVGVLAPRSGEVSVFDVTLRPDTADRIRRRVGLVFQDPDDQLFMPTIREDVAFGPLNLGLPPATIETLVSEALAAVGLQGYHERVPHHLSVGEKKRAAIAAVLSLKPELLVLDEPSAGLDPRSRRRLIEVLSGLESTKLIATHDLSLVAELCDEVALMDAGKIVCQGPVEEILLRQELLAEHGLEPARDLHAILAERK